METHRGGGIQSRAAHNTRRHGPEETSKCDETRAKNFVYIHVCVCNPSSPVSVLVVSSLSVDDHLSRGVLPLFGRVDVGDEHVLQAQVEALVLGVVRQEEEGAEAQGDEGTEDEEEDELLGEPQRRPVVREGGGAARRQRGDPAARQRQQSRRRHVGTVDFKGRGRGGRVSGATGVVVAARTSWSVELSHSCVGKSRNQKGPRLSAEERRGGGEPGMMILGWEEIKKKKGKS